MSDNTEFQVTGVRPKVAPDKDCPTCQGVGYFKDEQNAIRRCLCVLKQEAREYLTDIYVGAQWAKDFDVAKLSGRDFLFDAKTQAMFKQTVKSYLLNTGMKYTHLTGTGYDIMQAYLTNTETRQFKKFQECDLLLIYLVSDPKNGHYGNVMTSLIETRRLHKRATWVFTRTLVESQSFADVYQRDFANFLKSTFVVLK